MLRLVALLLVVAVSAEKGAKVGELCLTSEKCLLASDNSECHPETNRCVCEPGYGVDYDEIRDKTCKKFPFHKERYLRLEQGVDLDCKVYAPNVKEINWYRDGVLCAYGSTCSQDREMRYDEDDFYFQRRLWLLSLLSNNTYTCQVVTTDGKTWTVAENQVEVGFKFQLFYHMVAGSNSSLYCALDTSHLQIRLVRDGKDFCTPDATWCKQLKPTINQSGNSLWFDVMNMQSSQTFTCEAYNGDKKIGTIAVFHYVIGED